MKNYLLKPLLLYVLTGFVVSVGFNSCSDVEFSQPSNLKADFNPYGDSDDIDNLDDIVDGVLVDYKDTFTVQEPSSKVDVFLVIDNSGSMTEENKELGDKLSGFVAYLDGQDIDWQMCYTTTDASRSSGKALLWKKKENNGITNTNVRVIKATTANRAAYFDATVGQIGSSGSGKEEGITAIDKGIDQSGNSSCFRNNAVLSYILISDEDQKSCGGRCKNHSGSLFRDASQYRNQYLAINFEDKPDYLVQRFAKKWPKKPIAVNSIVIKPGDIRCYDNQDFYHPAFYGEFYAALSVMTNGVIGDICADSYTSQLDIIADQSIELLDSLSLKCPPIEEPVISIQPQPTNISINYQGNKVLFDPPLQTGTVVNVKYTCRINKI